MVEPEEVNFLVGRPFPVYTIAYVCARPRMTIKSHKLAVARFNHI